ncbi:MULTISPECIES: hypothetical protein [Ensifer]|jgi:hypothetical protein|uniref:Uncharacterized protein n=1 Tax=Ensifer canadensis TaxID=555315 RepID=A0AAW4FR79_9HYPH|nr:MULTISPECIES: hypothetical protein [Ensifer]MBD9491058.1 hypothetical protein [Ensifer sp. ENS11]MBM3093858.1 hypothetical protein [Ensifer canadensis]UBI78164.1 hypothetical protein J3R84_26995 [Ensifer canadensis]
MVMAFLCRGVGFSLQPQSKSPGFVPFAPTVEIGNLVRKLCDAVSKFVRCSVFEIIDPETIPRFVKLKLALQDISDRAQAFILPQDTHGTPHQKPSLSRKCANNGKGFIRLLGFKHPENYRVKQWIKGTSTQRSYQAWKSDPTACRERSISAPADA